MSNFAYVLVKGGAVVEIARPLQGSLNIYDRDDHFVQPIVDADWGSDGVWHIKLSFRRLKAHIERMRPPKKLDVAKKLKQIEKKWFGGYARADTATPGIRGFQHRADAARSAQKSRKQEAMDLHAWLTDRDKVKADRNRRRAARLARHTASRKKRVKKNRRRSEAVQPMPQGALLVEALVYTVRARDIRPGTRLELERIPVYARRHPPANKVSIKTVASVTWAGEDEDVLILRFKGMKLPGHNILRGFRGTVIKGKLVKVWTGSPRPTSYSVLGIV